MAAENSEPKTGIIVQIGILGIVGVLATRFALIPYFDHAVDELRVERVGLVAPQVWHQVRDAEMAKLNNGPMPIDRAKALYAAKGRSALGAELEPQPSKDFGALQGWANDKWKPLPRALPAILVPDPPPPETMDGGIADANVADGNVLAVHPAATKVPATPVTPAPTKNPPASGAHPAAPANPPGK